MHEPDDLLAPHLDRLMESAYEALASAPDGVRAAVEPAPVQPDRIGPYPVTGLLGRGGTSIVWKGFDPELGREIAIKVVDPRHAPGSALAQRFLDEARLCGGLTHPGIVPIYGIGRLADGRPWFTMRLVEGDTLATMLRARPDPAAGLQRLLEIFARTCETVAFAHTRGVVHGDLKPGNVMVGAHGQVQVVDWGFSRLVDEPTGTPARGIGTPAFMAPEQAACGAAAIDTRTDVFGLGAILCVILTGQPPFAGGTRTEVHVRAAQADLAGARERLLGSGADPDLVHLALACLAERPADRPADAAAVQDRVGAWFVSIERRARQLELAAAQAQVQAREQRRTRRRTGALVLLAGVFAAVYVWMQFDRQTRGFEARTAVMQAVERARSQRAGADVAGAERIRWLGEAALAARQASTFAATLADPVLSAEVDELVARYENDRDTAIADARMTRWLDDFPSHLDLTRDELDARFAAGFRDYGIDVPALPDDEVVARLRRRPIVTALARALDDWAFVRRLAPGVPAAEWRRFHELALASDDDPARSAVRRGLLGDDRDALRALAGDAVLAGATSETLDLLANGLDRIGERRAAIAVWKRANASSPDDVRVIHSLAVHWFSDPVSPPWPEIVRLFTAGTALRPTSAHLWTDLAHALLGAGDVAAAEAALQRALDIDPRDERAHAGLVDLLRCRCRPAGALAASAQVAARAGDAAAWRVHGDAQLLDGHVDAASEAYRRAAALESTAFHHDRLAQALLARGDAAAAAAAANAAVAVDAQHAGAHVQLGLAERLRGRFAEARHALERGRELGGTTWAARCDAWLAEIDRAAGHLARIDEADAGEPMLAEVAAVAFATGKAARAAELYRAAFADDARLAGGAFLFPHLDGAAQAAAAAGWRDEAAAFLRQSIADVRTAYDAGSLSAASVRLRLAAWRGAPALADLLPDAEVGLSQLTAALAAPVPAVVVHAPFDRWLTFHALGNPAGVLAPYGGLLIEPGDPDVVIVAGHAQRRTAALFAVGLRRDADGHVDGFRDDVRWLAAAPFADGGLVRGPRHSLFYTRYPGAEIGRIRAGDVGATSIAKLGGPSAGGLALVPEGLPGAGRTKILTWPGGQWTDASLTFDGDAASLVAPRRTATLPGGPDGIAYVAGGTAPFPVPHVLVAEWSAGGIAAYALDANGDPVPASRRPVASGCRGVLGLAVDPRTGDILLTTWRGDGTELMAALRCRAH